MSGSWGAGCFSFYPTKNMTTGEGGMLTTADPDLADRVRLLREHGMTVRYHHDTLGYNFRMTDIHAAIGLAQLTKLPAFNARRREIAARYDAELRGVVIPKARAGVTHVYHQYTLRVARRDEFAAATRGAWSRQRRLLPDSGASPEAVPGAGVWRCAVPGQRAAGDRGRLDPGPPRPERRGRGQGDRGGQRGGRRAGVAAGGGPGVSGAAEGSLRAGVIGLGSMGRNHARVWDEEIGQVELVAVADPRSEALSACTDERSVRGYADAVRHAGGGGARPGERGGSHLAAPRPDRRRH